MNEKRKKPNYTEEFKQNAVSLVLEHGYNCHEAARRLGTPASNVSRWVRHFWAKGYCVSTIGFDEDQIRKYVRWQMHKDRSMDQRKLWND